MFILWVAIFTWLATHVQFGNSDTENKNMGITGDTLPNFSPMDPGSFSRPDLAVVTHIKISLQVCFDKKVFSGNADLTINKVDNSVNEVVLDVKKLNIESIVANKTGDKLNYAISDQIEEFGSKLSVELPPGELNDFIITIYYETSPEASGLQWLDKEQTLGKAFPYVFSQFQSIHARSFLPCQDTSGVKTTYEAVITSPSDLTVLMSAIRHDKQDMPGRSTYYFKQDVPMPSYLIGIVIGKLESRCIGPRSTVWAEKEIVEAAAYEFANTEKQLKAAEEICGPYIWGTYDLLVLPPSFPYGGMENPCLTFVTPTLLAGDRSLVNVIAHEIAHSWSGNLVTNANFEHFWVNEGFTVFIERKILGRLEGKQVQDFQGYAGTGELREAINQLGEENPLTKLVLDLKGVHPDDAYSKIPYEKGHTFLRYLENVIGGPDKFEPFLRKYFETNKYKSVTSDQFKTFFEDSFCENAEIKKIDWNTWLHKPGMPPVIPDYDKTLLKSIESLKQRWLTWNETENDVPFNISEIDSLQISELLQEIIEVGPQPIKKLEMIEEKFKLSDIKNSEIKFRWLRIGIKAKWEHILNPTLKWVNEVGRIMFTKPLYRDLYGWETKRNEVISNFKEHRKDMMQVSANTIARDLHLQ